MWLRNFADVDKLQITVIETRVKLNNEILEDLYNKKLKNLKQFSRCLVRNTKFLYLFFATGMQIFVVFCNGNAIFLIYFALAMQTFLFLHLQNKCFAFFALTIYFFFIFGTGNANLFYFRHWKCIFKKFLALGMQISFIFCIGNAYFLYFLHWECKFFLFSAFMKMTQFWKHFCLSNARNWQFLFATYT